MNNLSNLKLKSGYDPCVDGTDVINEFYIPCLSNSKKYDRCSAYFSSAVLKQFSVGLINFCQNGGHARFIFSCEIIDSEMNDIISAYESLENESFENKMDEISENFSSSLDNDYEIANLAYLIKKQKAEVKIAFMIRHRSAIMHIKSGLFEDEFHNKVYFEGSGNETEYGVSKNAEIFSVFNNFEGENEYVRRGEERFDQLWDNTYSQSTIKTVYPSGKLFQKLISYSKDKIFQSQEEYFINENCIYIDINVQEKWIILSDYTSKQFLRLSQVLKSNYGDRMENVGDSLYFINSLTLRDIKDIIPSRLERYGAKFIYSKNAEDYILLQNLQLDKRVKLAESIKTGQNTEIWTKDYQKFKSTVQHEMVATLKDKQFENAYHHYAMKSSMDFSVPGTGKTFIAYGLFAYLFSTYEKKQDVNQLVVFGPLNCFKAWKEECKNIFGDMKKFTIFDITENQNNYEQKLRDEKYHIYLFNYESITERKYHLISKHVLNTKTLLVFDEIHKLKSINGTRAKNVIAMLSETVEKPIYKLALTGTPLPNSFVDLYNYLRILYSDDLNGFLSLFSENQLRTADTTDSVAERIQNNLHPLFTRTTKRDLDIPLANEDDLNSLSVIPTQDEEELFKLIHMSYTNPLLKYIRLIQASSNPKLLLSNINIVDFKELYEEDFDVNDLDDDFNNDFNNDPNNAEQIKDLIEKIDISSKLKKTIDFIKEKSQKGEKVIVWCLFIDTIDLLYEKLTNDGVKCMTITGRDEIQNRSDKIDSFKFKDVQVLITNPNTLAESVSLHKQCHNAIYLEFGFNLTYLLQSKDRIHRVGLEEDSETNYYFSLTKNNGKFGSIDMYIYNRLQMKAQRMLETIESNNLIPVNDTSDIDDIKYILSLFN